MSYFVDTTAPTLNTASVGHYPLYYPQYKSSTRTGYVVILNDRTLSNCRERLPPIPPLPGGKSPTRTA